MRKNTIISTIAIGAFGAAIGFAVAVAILSWGAAKATEFYGSFTAAIVAAIAVILGAYYQAELSRKRDDALLKEGQIADATDLFLWLGHAIEEMRFISWVLNSFREGLVEKERTDLDMNIEQYREVVSSQFMDELKDRAKISARISPLLGSAVAPILYKTFLAADRVYRFRGANPGSHGPTITRIEQHIFVTDCRISDLRSAQSRVAEFLKQNGIAMLADKDEQL